MVTSQQNTSVQQSWGRYLHPCPLLACDPALLIPSHLSCDSFQGILEAPRSPVLQVGPLTPHRWCSERALTPWPAVHTSACCNAEMGVLESVKPGLASRFCYLRTSHLIL